MKIIGVGFGRDGAVLSVPNETDAELVKQAYEQVLIPKDAPYGEIFHIAVKQLAKNLGGRVVTEEWHNLGY